MDRYQKSIHLTAASFCASVDFVVDRGERAAAEGAGRRTVGRDRRQAVAPVVRGDAVVLHERGVDVRARRVHGELAGGERLR